MAETWKDIAIALGNRMANHSVCDEEKWDPGDLGTAPRIVKAHPNSADFPDCPQCADREAYLRFLAKMFTERERDHNRSVRYRPRIVIFPRD